MMRPVGLLLGLACLLLLAQPATAGLLPCFPSLADVISNKFSLDKATVFRVLQNGSPMAMPYKLCPGATYTVRVEFPDPRTYFVSSTKGFFNGLLPSLACPNQLTNNQSTLVTSIDLPFTVGCNVKGFSVWGIASLKKTDLFNFNFLNISMPVLGLSACPASFCNNTTPSTANNTVPAYGQCGGAGGECAKYGYCDDRAFPGYKCTAGWSCQRQHRWYYQCLPATGVLPSVTGCDFSAFGEPIATMMSGLGMICTLKSGLMTFALDTLKAPKAIDPFAMLQVFSGLTALKASAVQIDPVSLLTTFKSLCTFVPNTNSTQAVMVVGMQKFLTIVTDKVMPAASNNTQLATAAFNVLSSMGTAAYSGSYADLTKSLSLDSMLSMVTNFGNMMALVKNFGLL